MIPPQAQKSSPSMVAILTIMSFHQLDAAYHTHGIEIKFILASDFGNIFDKWFPIRNIGEIFIAEIFSKPALLVCAERGGVYFSVEIDYIGRNETGNAGLEHSYFFIWIVPCPHPSFIKIGSLVRGKVRSSVLVCYECQ